MQQVFSRIFFLGILLSGVVVIITAAFFLYKVDYVVNNDLYEYGLISDQQWQASYWTYMRSTLGLLVIVITVNSVGISYVLTTKFITRSPTPLKFGLVLLSVGSLLLTGSGGVLVLLLSGVPISADFNITGLTQTTSFAGLGLILWGGIFLYIKNERYVKEILLEKTISSPLTVLDQVVTNLGLKGQAVYLPSTYSENFQSSRVYIKKTKKGGLPTPKQLLKKEEVPLLINSRAACFLPPGVDIARVLEKFLGKSFIKSDLQHFQKNISRILIEDIEIAENVKVWDYNNKVHIKLENTVYSNICRETRKLTSIYGSVGCPICSALACALTEITGKPVIIDSEQGNEIDHSIETEYHFVELPAYTRKKRKKTITKRAK